MFCQSPSSCRQCMMKALRKFSKLFSDGQLSLVPLKLNCSDIKNLNRTWKTAVWACGIAQGVDRFYCRIIYTCTCMYHEWNSVFVAPKSKEKRPSIC